MNEITTDVTTQQDELDSIVSAWARQFHKGTLQIATNETNNNNNTPAMFAHLLQPQRYTQIPKTCQEENRPKIQPSHQHANCLHVGGGIIGRANNEIAAKVYLDSLNCMVHFYVHNQQNPSSRNLQVQTWRLSDCNDPCFCVPWSTYSQTTWHISIFFHP